MKLKAVIDKNKVKSLKRMATITLERLNKTDKLKYPSNTLDDYYDILHHLMEALAILEGVKIKGEGSHKELIDFVSEKYTLSQEQNQFLQ